MPYSRPKRTWEWAIRGKPVNLGMDRVKEFWAIRPWAIRNTNSVRVRNRIMVGCPRPGCVVSQRIERLVIPRRSRVRIPPTQHYYLHIFSPDDESCSGFLLPKTLIFYPLCFRVKIFSKYIGNCLHGIKTPRTFVPTKRSNEAARKNRSYDYSKQRSFLRYRPNAAWFDDSRPSKRWNGTYDGYSGC